MAHRCKPVSHPADDFRPRRDEWPPRRGDGLDERSDGVAQVEHVFKRQGVIHRTTLELAAVLQNLFARLCVQNLETPIHPPLRLRSREEQPGEDERLRIDEEMIAQQMKLESTRKPACLNRQALKALCGKHVAVKRELDPVDEAQRCRIRFPTGTGTW